jgi:crossover junction endodeoxyribonuclease RuvC
LYEYMHKITMPSDKPLRILGIDPGYDRLGIAIIDKSSSGKEVLIYSDCLQTSAKDPIYDRLKSIGTEIARILNEFKPDILAIETLFITKNQKTAMRVSEARGIIIYEALKHDIPVHEYAPMEIKIAITGDGTSDKTRMIKMVRLLIAVPDKKTADDEYDAIAIALTASASPK